MSEFPNCNIDKYIGKIVDCSINGQRISEPVLVNFYGSGENSNEYSTTCYVVLTTLNSVSFINGNFDLINDNIRSNSADLINFKYRFGTEKRFYFFIAAKGDRVTKTIEPDSYNKEYIIHEVLGDGIDVHSDITHNWVKLPVIKYRKKEFMVIY